MPPDAPRSATLTERILRALPGTRSAWIAIWVGVVLARPLIVVAVDEGAEGWRAVWEAASPNIASTLVFGYMVFVSLFAIARLGRDARALEPSIGLLLPAESRGAESSMAEVESTVWPLVLTVAATVFSFSEETLMHGALAAAVGTLIAFVVNLPVMTLLWVLVSVLRGFARIGRTDLALDDQFGNPSLGLALVGLLAFNGFMAFLAVLLPFLLVSIQRPRDLAVGLAFAIAPVVLELVSLYRLHLQMVASRVRYVTWTRRLYSDVLRPVRAEPTPAKLAERTALVTAAEALVRRSEATQEWPLTDRSFGIMLGVIAGVVTSIVARVVMGGFGL